MSVQNATEFLFEVGEDNALATQLKEVKTTEELIGIAQSKGFQVSVEDLKSAQAMLESEELAEDALESVAGGAIGGGLKDPNRQSNVDPSTFRRVRTRRSIWGIPILGVIRL